MYTESVRCYVFYTFINFIDINWNRKLNLICAYNVPETILGTFRYVNLWSLQQNFEAHIIMDTETENQSKLYQNNNKNIENSILI